MLKSLNYAYTILSGSIKLGAYANYALCVQLNPALLYSHLYFFKKHSMFKYTQLIDVAVVDTVEKQNRFLVSYVLVSPLFNTKLFLTTRCSELAGLNSISTLYDAACWAEREIWDMYGIFFFHHNSLKRILSDYGFKGFPLRKDFPLTGFVEVSYNGNLKKVTYRNVVLMQEYRNFYFEHYFAYWIPASKLI